MRRRRPVSPAAKARPPARSCKSKLSLQSFLPYRLNILAQAVSGGFSVAYSKIFGISAPEWRVLATVGEFDQITARDIADHSGMHKATVSRAVRMLEKRQVLIRSPSSADRREENLSLSVSGRRIYETVVPMAVHYEHCLLDGLSDADLANLDRLVRHLAERAKTPWNPPAPFRPSRRATKSPEHLSGSASKAENVGLPRDDRA